MDRLYRDTELVEVYDAINTSRDDFDFYIQELPNPPASVLDVGCGTGTFAIELAQLGYAVTAVDPAAQMIAAAKRKDIGGCVEWITGFVDDLSADMRFDAAVMTGHAFQCLLNDTEIEALFESVEKRLKLEGSFWFESRNPSAKAWQRWTPEHAAAPITLADGRSLTVTHEFLEEKGGFVTFEERYEFSDRKGVLVSQSTLRFSGLDEIEDLATASGLELAEVFGDWSKGALQPGSPEIIVRLTKRP